MEMTSVFTNDDSYDILFGTFTIKYLFYQISLFLINFGGQFTSFSDNDLVLEYSSFCLDHHAWEVNCQLYTGHISHVNICGTNNETIIHTLRDYPKAMQVWNSYIFHLTFICMRMIYIIG